MGTSIYVYKTEKEYLNHYKRMDQEVMYSAPIIDIFLKEDKKLWVVSKISKHKERPQLGRSIVHFINGTIFDYANGQEIAIEKNNIRYNPKKGVVEFFPKKLRKAELEIKVDRFYGDELKKKTNIDNTKRYYDISRDRMNFILQDGSL
tara:strand:+ start:67 stop:510 length:444 start_codon:yes stop_codon:yes gene_type:complete